MSEKNPVATPTGHKVTIDGTEHVFLYNMAALEAIQAQGYNTFMDAFQLASGEDVKAMKVVIWAGLLHPFLDRDTGEIDTDKAPKLGLLSAMTLDEMGKGLVTAMRHYVEVMPDGPEKTKMLAALNGEKVDLDPPAKAPQKPRNSSSKKKG